MLAQAVAFGFRIGEISCPTEYFPEASSINFRCSVVYGLGGARHGGRVLAASLGTAALPTARAAGPAVVHGTSGRCPDGSHGGVMSTLVPPRPLRAGRTMALVTDVVLLVFVVCAGLVVRIVRAGSSGLWRDEGLFLFVVDSPTVASMLEFLRLHESHPPLFYLLMRFWRALVGRSLETAQMLPVLLGVMQVPVTYLVGTRMFSRRAGLLAVVLVAFSPALVYYSVLVRPYSLLPLLGLVSTYYLWSGLRGGGRRAWLGYVLATLMMAYTHNWTLVFWMAHGVLVCAWFCWFRGPGTIIRGWALAQLGILVGYVPWVPVFVDQARIGGHLPAPVDSLYRLKLSVGMLNAVLSPFHSQALTALLGIALVAAVVWLEHRRSRSTPEDRAQWPAVVLLAALPFVAWVIALVLSGRTNLLHERCLVITTPCFLLAVAQALAMLTPTGNPALPALLVLVLVAADVRAIAIRSHFIRSNAREMAAAVAAQVQPSDLVVIAPEALASSFNLYFRPDNAQINYPHEGRVEAMQFDHFLERWADPRAMKRILARLDQAQRQGRRVWLILERSGLRDNVPPPDVAPSLATAEDYSHVGVIRANQVRKYLIGLYGPADGRAVPPDPRPMGGGTPGSELDCLDVYLFCPSAPARVHPPERPRSVPAAQPAADA
jgi:4-amino-4-deoxy-L-arabinose transferase-like glycosyltransferase